MVKITKGECDYLLSKGFKFHEDLHRPYSKSKAYYMTESTKAIKALYGYRDSKIIASFKSIQK